jgi:hypothetical protein
MPMRKIAVIDPREQKVVYKTVPDQEISLAGGIDLTTHTIVHHGGSSYGLFNNAAQPSTAPEYYALNGQLYHGIGVLYAFDQQGRTLNISPRSHPQPLWIGPYDSVRAALNIGLVKLPQSWE